MPYKIMLEPEHTQLGDAKGGQQKTYGRLIAHAQEAKRTNTGLDVIAEVWERTNTGQWILFERLVIRDLVR